MIRLIKVLAATALMVVLMTTTVSPAFADPLEQWGLKKDEGVTGTGHGTQKRARTMLTRLKSLARAILFYLGYEINRISADLGQDPFRDMRKLVVTSTPPVIFDVGANIGQSINLFRKHFDKATIHAFEPAPDTYRELQLQTADIPDLHLNNFALGSRVESKVFAVNELSVMSSFLEPSVDWWGEVKERSLVEVSTLDDYCAKHKVTHIDVLKTDTQGFDLEVIKGGRTLIEQRRIHLIYIELTFCDMYKGSPSFDEIYRFLIDCGFLLVTFYPIYYRHERAGWTDALFVNPEYQQSRLE